MIVHDSERCVLAALEAASTSWPDIFLLQIFSSFSFSVFFPPLQIKHLLIVHDSERCVLAGREGVLEAASAS